MYTGLPSYRSAEKEKDADKGNVRHADDDGDGNGCDAMVAGEDTYIR